MKLRSAQACQGSRWVSNSARGCLRPGAKFNRLFFNDVPIGSFSSVWCLACWEWPDSFEQGLCVRSPDGAIGTTVQGEDSPGFCAKQVAPYSCAASGGQKTAATATQWKEKKMSSRQPPMATLPPENSSLVDGILTQFSKLTSSDVIPLLQAVQQRCGYLPREVLEEIARRTRVSLTRIYGVATFYERFRFQATGQHVIQACHGTACHVNGAKQIGRALHQTLHIKDRETTADGLFTLETVACLGCCSLAPVMMIDDTVYGRLNPQGAQRILSRYRHGAGH